MDVICLLLDLGLVRLQVSSVTVIKSYLSITNQRLLDNFNMFNITDDEKNIRIVVR